MKNLPIEFQKIIVDKKGYFAEIKFHDIFNTVNNIFPWLVLSFKRPKFDEKQIRSDVAHRRANKIAEWLFTEEMKKKMDEETEQAINTALINHNNLPVSVALPADLVEFKYWKRILKVSINKEALEYFIENIAWMNMMYMSIQQIFIYQDKSKTKAEAKLTIESSLDDLDQSEPKKFILLSDD